MIEDASDLDHGALSTPELGGQLPEIRTFMIADVRGYTRFTHEHGDEAGAELASRFATLVRDVVTVQGGIVVELRGDEALAAFTSARQALRAAARVQDRAAEETRAHPDTPLTVGIGLDAGEAVEVEGGYRGGALNLASRLCSLAQPGEILSSETVAHLARRVEGLIYVERGLVDLKGFSESIRVIQVMASLSDMPTGRSVPHINGEPQTAGTEDPAAARPKEVMQLPVGGFLGAVPESPLVARDREVGQISEILDAVSRRSGRALLLAGEPGIGKTRLAQEAMMIARQRQFVVASASCLEQRRAVPLAPIIDLLRSLYSVASHDIRDSIPRRWPLLARLLPDQALSMTLAPIGQQENEWLFRSLVDLLRTISVASPVALMLDDLQAADTSTLHALVRIARETRADHVLILATYRDVDVDRDHPLEAALLDLHHNNLAEELHLTRLDRQETGALATSMMETSLQTDRVVEVLYERTEGNPFFIREMVRSLDEDRRTQPASNGRKEADLSTIDVPDRVRAVIGQRVSRLGDREQEILRVASVIGQTFSFDALQFVGEWSEEEIEFGLERALATGLIRELAGEQYAFVHALTQQALYSELPSRRRRRLHLATAGFLEQTPPREREAQSSELAWHFLEGREPVRALPYALRAADRAASLYAYPEAERLYRVALDITWELSADDGDPSLREAEVLNKLAVILLGLGRNEEALEVLERAGQIHRDVGAANDDRALLLLARARLETGDLGGAEALAARVFATAASRRDRPAQADVLWIQASIRSLQSRWAEAHRLFDASLAVAKDVASPYREARILVDEGMLFSREGDVRGAREKLTAAQAIFEKLGATVDVGRAQTALAELSD